MADIDELQIKIKADSAKASNSIESLVNSMNRLRESISFDTAKLSNIASGIRSISDAATGFKGGKSSEITSMVRALNKFSGVDANSIHGISSAVRDLASGIASVKAVDTSGLISMVSALSKIGGKASTQATKNLPALSAQLQNFVRQMNKIGALNFDMTNMSNLVTAISRLGSVASGRAVTNIPLLADNLKYLFETLSKAPNVSANILQMTQALGNLSNRSGGAITGLNNSISNLSGSFLGFKTSTGKALIGLKSFTRQILSSMGIYLGLYGAIRGIKNAIDISSALTEVQNVVDVTFGDMSKKVNDFAQDSIRQFGMSELTLKQTASRFQAMGTAMGIDSSLIKKANEFLNKQTDGYIGLSDSMADVSLNLTKLTADMASLYNIDQDVVSQDLAAIFTGQTRPLRDYGLDLTQATLKEWAMKQGLDSDIESMSQAEKTMLRYQYVLANTQTAQGDFARTADSWANQIRILKQSFEQLGSVIGGALINAFKPFVKALNSVLLVVISFVTKVTNALGAIFGWKYEDSGAGLADSFSDAAESAGDVADNTGQAAKNIDKMNKGVRQFDELKLITTNDGSGKKGSGGSGGGGASGGASGGKLVKTDTIFKNYESDIKNLKQLGKYISDALSKAMESINWDKIYSKARNFGKDLADFLNGLINPRLFGNVGKTIAGALNTAIYATLSFGQTFDWSNFGKSLAEGINKFFKTFDFKALAEDINTWVQGVYKTIKTMIENIKWSDVWKGVKDFLSNIDIETVEILLGAFALKLAGKLLTGKLLKETIGKLIGAKFTAAFGQTAVKSLLSYAIPISLAVVVATLSFTIGKKSVNKDKHELMESLNRGGITQYIQDSIKKFFINPFERIDIFGGGALHNKTAEWSKQLDDFVKNIPKKQDYKSLDDFQKAVNEYNEEVPLSLNVPNTTELTGFFDKWKKKNGFDGEFSLKTWIDEWKELNGLEDVDLHANVVLPNLQEKISEFKDNVKEWWGLNVELPVRNKLTTTLEDVSSWWEDVKEYWGEKKLSIQTEIGEIKGKIEEKWNEALTYIQENIFPWFTKEKWMEVGNGIKEGLSAKWDEFSDWWQKTGIYNWWENHVKPWFTKEKWDEQGDGMKKGLSEKWDEFSNWWSTSGIGSWWTNHVAPYFTKDKWTFSGISDGLKQAFDNAVAGIKQVWNNFATWLNSKLSFSWDSVNIGGKEIIQAGNINLGKIPTFAAGGFPKQYSMFMAGENGVPEILGTVGGKTAVAGGQEITGIRDAVYSTSQQEIALLKQQNQLLSEILKKPMLSNNDVFNAAKSVYKGEAKRRYGDSAAFDPVWG
jgi:hypothetical protein|nr:MAG TPA: minor tail protein [Caudoviricetes sp.]DAP20531.1 MAG TPA: minor tail protein [Caudoviricetes sp.]